MKRCHQCNRVAPRFRSVTDKFGLRVILCLICAVRWDR